MAKNELKREPRPVEMKEALRRHADDIEFDVVPVAGSNANLRIESGTKIPSRRRVAGFLGRAAAYFAVEKYLARFKGPRERRKDEMIAFAQKHAGIRGVYRPEYKLAVYPSTTTTYNDPAMKEELGEDYDKVVSNTWNATVKIPKGHETALGTKLTPEMLTRALLGMVAVAGFDEKQIQSSVVVKDSQTVDETVLYEKVKAGDITDEQLARMGTAEETWVVRLTPELEGIAEPDLDISVPEVMPIPLQP